MRPLVLAHRGHRDAGPENSLSSVRAAFQVCDGAEVDVLATADGRAILRHDERLEDGSPIRLRTLAELRDATGTDADDLPEVMDVLAAIANVGSPTQRLNLELKGPGSARALAPLAGKLSRVAFTSFFATEVLDARALFPDVPCGFLTSHDSIRFVPPGTSFLSVLCWVLPEVRAAFPSMECWAWTINDEAGASLARKAGCTAVIGDDIAALDRWFPPS